MTVSLPRGAGASSSPAPPRVVSDKMFVRYGVAVFAVGVVLALKLLLRIYVEEESPFLLFFAAVMLAAWYGGLGPGLFATALAVLVSDFFFLEPTYSFALASNGQAVRLLIFALEGALVSVGIGLMHRADARHRQSAESLRESEGRYRLHVDEVGDHAFITLDAAGRVTSWNEGARRIFGYESAEMIGRTTEMLFTEEDARAGVHEQELEIARRDGRADDIRWQRRRDGTRFYANGAVTAIHDERGNLRGFSKVLRDDTARKESEDALRDALRQIDFHVEHSPIAVIEWDSDFRITRWSDAAEKLFGWSEKEVTGRRFDDWRFVYDDDTTIVRETSARNDQPNVMRNRNYTKDGRVLHCEWYNSTLADETGRRVSVVSRVLDTTPRDEALARLAASEERYRAFVAQSSEGIWRFEVREPLDTNLPVERQVKHIFAQGYLAECNDAMARMYGYERADDLVGASLGEMMDETRAENVAYIERFIRSGYRLTDAESIEITKDGTERWFSNNLVGIVEAGVVRRAWGTQRDITATKRAEAERLVLLERERIARHAAEDGSRAKDEFLATLSHELRTPLTPILGWVHMMRARMLPAKDFDHGLAVINKNASSLTHIINDLLDMSAILNDKVSLDRAPVDLTDVLREAVETSDAQAAPRRIRIDLELPPDASRRPPIVEGDYTRLVQIFWNLLNNAVKFSDEGSRVVVRCEHQDREVHVHVEDQGVGIDPEFIPHVFSRFRQADQSTTRAFGGLGLGLSLAKSFVEAHAGDIAVSSAGENQGSRFTVRLQLANPTTADRAADKAGVRTPAGDGWTDNKRADDTDDTAGVEARAATSARPRRVLIIDDAPDTLDMLKAVFEQAGFAVTLCGDAHSALDVFAREDFACVVSDIGMPETDGYELLRRLRADRSAHDRDAPPAIALTGYASAKDADAARAAGFARHLAKPVDPQMLVHVVEELLTIDATGGRLA